MNVISKFFQLVVLATLIPLSLSAESSLGRFVGVLEHKAIKKQQLAKLDFIASRETGNELELSAILTLHFGDFRSQEYVAFHFHDVRYNILNKTLVFAQEDQDTVLKVDTFSGTNLAGTLYSTLGGGEIGTLTLEKEGVEIKPTLPLIERVWGEYKGTCEGEETSLQLYTARSTEDISKTANPFATYKIRGIRGKLGTACSRPNPTVCTNAIYDSGEYNFYKRKLVLYGRPRPLTCVPDGSTLNCDGCILTKVSKDFSDVRDLNPVVHEENILGTVISEPALTNAAESLEGEYKGYLFHEYLNRYQPVTIDLVTFQDTSTGSGTTLKMSATATIYFGAPGSGENISYRFMIRNYPNPLSQMQFVFSRAEEDVDAVLQVTTLGKGEMKGTWFSQVFGRVGKFVLTKGEFPTLPPEAKTMEPISGWYESSMWDLDLTIRGEQTGKTPASTENPFFPRSFDGGFIMKNGATPRIRITGGSYDFYTGRMALEVETANRLIIGQRDSQSRLFLRWMTPNFVVPTDNFDLQPYRFLGAP